MREENRKTEAALREELRRVQDTLRQQIDTKATQTKDATIQHIKDNKEEILVYGKASYETWIDRFNCCLGNLGYCLKKGYDFKNNWHNPQNDVDFNNYKFWLKAMGWNELVK